MCVCAQRILWSRWRTNGVWGMISVQTPYRVWPQNLMALDVLEEIYVISFAPGLMKFLSATMVLDSAREQLKPHGKHWKLFYSWDHSAHRVDHILLYLFSSLILLSPRNLTKLNFNKDPLKKDHCFLSIDLLLLSVSKVLSKPKGSHFQANVLINIFF